MPSTCASFCDSSSSSTAPLYWPRELGVADRNPACVAGGGRPYPLYPREDVDGLAEPTRPDEDEPPPLPPV
jgi:hypothetical protein